VTLVDEAVRRAIERHGPVPFEQVMERALYDPVAGFYRTGGRAGRRGDFITSPEVGGLFGAVVARALDRWWEDAGRPAVFAVIDAGAGPGTLARTVLASAPACAEALRYVLVESSSEQRALHAERLALEPSTAAFASIPDPDEDARPAGAVPPGPVVVSMAELPRVDGPCVVLANELLDNLPFGLAQRTADGWAEVHVGRAPGGDLPASAPAAPAQSDSLVEVLLPLDRTWADRLERLAPAAPVGARVPVARHANRWIGEALAAAGPGGRVVAFDYGRPTRDLAAIGQEGWLRTYRDHGRGGPPLERLGTQDITADVPIDQLLPAPDFDVAQAEWLAAHGLDELVEDGRRTWHERAHLGDLEALRARSRIGEAEALTDPAGLGAFRVLEWQR